MVLCKGANENYRCITTINGFEIVSDVSIDKGGQGNGIRPHDILETAFASCLNMTVRMKCEKIEISSSDISVKVDLQRDEFKTVFKYQVLFGNTLLESQMDEILEALENCPVRNTLSKPIAFSLIND